MKKSDFFYNLPAERIAQKPADPRDSSRLLCLDKNTGAIAHHTFRDISQLLTSGDLLVINTTKVMHARLLGKKATGGALEVLLTRQIDDSTWECMTKPSLKVGASFSVASDKIPDGVVGECIEELGYTRKVRFEKPIAKILPKLGALPLPPYITTTDYPDEWYQTSYAKELGSVAAPTAGLHFTPAVFDELASKGITTVEVTLHVGPGTFLPVKTEHIEDHKMHAEYGEILFSTIEKIRETKRNGGRVIAVGTTATRTLEYFSQVINSGNLPSENPSAWIDLFIYPPYRFQVIDGMLTNFHLPESTLIMLVSALAGREQTLHAYDVAVEEGYRFYSFGDAMLVL